MTVGQGQFRYDLDESWGRMPDGDRLRYVSMVACDAEDRIYAFCRAGEPVRILDPAGQLITAWGEGQFLRPHGIAVAPNGLIYVADDKAHVVRSFTFEGKPVRTWGRFGIPRITSRDGRFEGGDTSLPLFFAPTHVGFAADGTMFVTDGYGNSEVHRFSEEGEWEMSWGEAGDGPGQFKEVHAVCLDSKERLFISDRGHNRLQVYSKDGHLLHIINDALHPNQMQCDRDDYIYYVGTGRVDIRDSNGKLVCRWGKDFTDEQVTPAEVLPRSHGLAVDSAGNIYLGDELHDHGGFLRKYSRV